MDILLFGLAAVGFFFLIMIFAPAIEHIARILCFVVVWVTVLAAFLVPTLMFWNEWEDEIARDKKTAIRLYAEERQMCNGELHPSQDGIMTRCEHVSTVSGDYRTRDTAKVTVFLGEVPVFAIWENPAGTQFWHHYNDGWWRVVLLIILIVGVVTSFVIAVIVDMIND